MSDQTCILVFGVGPLASATARLLLLAGFAVALHQREAPKVLRRKMSFADAWSRGRAMLDGVEARLVRGDAEFLAGLRQKSFIPLLRQPFAGAAERWPWDAIVDARREDGGLFEKIDYDASLRIGLGAGCVAGEDCDLAIAIDGPDPGAIIRKGAIRQLESEAQDRSLRARGRIVAPLAGLFTTELEIGALVAKGAVLGGVEDQLILSPFAGRLLGLRESGAAVAAGEPIAEVGVNLSEPFAGVARSDQALARAILLAVQMELNGWTPVTLDHLV
jgi:xanthine dehydrogenase accessory factor